MALVAGYWLLSLGARAPFENAAQPTAAIADAPEAEAVLAAPEVFAFEPEVPIEPEPVAAEPKKRRARKAPKAAAVAAPIVESPEPVVIEEPVYTGPPLQQLFDPQPLVREARPAFGRKSRGPRPLSAA